MWPVQYNDDCSFTFKKKKMCPINIKFLKNSFIKNFSGKYKKLVLRPEKQIIYVWKTSYSKNYGTDSLV